MSFSLDTKTLAEVKLSAINGEKCLGSYRITFQVDFVFYPREEEIANLIELGGEVRVVGKGGGQNYLGLLSTKTHPMIITIGKYTNTCSEILDIELDHRQIEAIENVRMGEGLTFNISLWGRVIVNNEHKSVHHEGTLTVNQGTWIDILDKCGYSKIILLEIPVPNPEESPSLYEAVSFLQKSQNSINRGEYREAVGICRDVLESMSKALSDRDDQDQEVQLLFANSRSMDKEARKRVVRRALKLLCHPARHADEVSTEISWNRSNATSLIAIITALIWDIP